MSSIEANHEPIDIARKGSEVCIKIDSTSSDKLNQDHTHNLCTSFVALWSDLTDEPRVHQYGEELLPWRHTKADWQLIELKRTFEIL